MTRVLVVDDARLDRVLIEALLNEEQSFDVEIVDSAAHALRTVARHQPEVVVTDLVMPEMDGIALVSELRRLHAGLPVILLTSRGSEDIAVQALAAGAASYVPKRVMQEHLIETICDVVALSREQHAERELCRAMQRGEYEFDLDSDVSLIQPLVRHVQSAILLMGICDETESNQIAIALHEALQNAVEHGNLELDSKLRNEDLSAYCALLKERAKTPPFSERRVHVRASVDRQKARFVIRDEGPGFAPDRLPDALADENLDRLSGRGVLLMRTFMDEVTFNETGNEVTLVKFRDVK